VKDSTSAPCTICRDPTHISGERSRDTGCSNVNLLAIEYRQSCDDLERLGRHVGEVRKLEGWRHHYLIRPRADP
jgi:hypothetical protein